ncbi:MAG: 5-formyltetrahydrofolate cyclo-ligase [Thermoguttaceae bacterium]|jgi:5-formyltetrahydrofolate cyclo-ligase
MEQFESLRRRKQEIRAEAQGRRRCQPCAELTGRRITDRLRAMPEYGAAATVLSYVSFRSEVPTREFIEQALADGKRVAVPWCVEDRLELFRLEGLADLAPGSFGILEPRPEVRLRPERRAAVEELDLVVVPGLAFDPHCGRIGYGRGYFDRLLARAGGETALVAVAFQCQIFAEVPMLPGDVRMDAIVTETKVYRRGD